MGSFAGQATLSDTSTLTVLAEVSKAGFFGACGFGLKWLLAKHSAQAQEVRDCLQLIDRLAADAEKSARLIGGAQPDYGLSAAVLAARTSLGQSLNRALGKTVAFSQVRTAMALFGVALLAADWTNGAPIDDTAIELIAQRQVELRSAVQTAAELTLAWRLYRHSHAKS